MAVDDDGTPTTVMIEVNLAQVVTAQRDDVNYLDPEQLPGFYLTLANGERAWTHWWEWTDACTPHLAQLGTFGGELTAATAGLLALGQARRESIGLQTWRQMARDPRFPERRRVSEG